MDIYLPNDFYQLRGDLPDWRDAPASGEVEHKAESREEGADPNWQAL
jgi:hypothetical protein